MSRPARIFPPTCSGCGNRLGCIQYQFEELTSKGAKPVEAIRQLGFRKMCCLNQTLNCPMYFIVDADIERISDRKNLLLSESDINRDTPPIQLSRIPPSFPDQIITKMVSPKVRAIPKIIAPLV